MNTLPKWYTKRRKNMKLSLTFGKILNSAGAKRYSDSPNDKYVLYLAQYETGDNAWPKTYVEVFDTEANKIIKKIVRDSPYFVFDWLCDMPGKKDGPLKNYLIFSEDDLSYSIMELGTGKISTHVAALKEDFFIWRSVFVNIEGDTIAVYGSQGFDGIREIRFYDIRKPMRVPYPEVGRVDTIVHPGDSRSENFTGIFGWDVIKEGQISKLLVEGKSLILPTGGRYEEMTEDLDTIKDDLLLRCSTYAIKPTGEYELFEADTSSYEDEEL